ncbi:NUDIX domain-containing protein [Kribbella sp. NPDC005582]|uniref:NUDIX domain-containing protein n=1 Tax=Kribbella sp. NPDC005582 TaxID=3156893 RepID=UPI0033B9255D
MSPTTSPSTHSPGSGANSLDEQRQALRRHWVWRQTGRLVLARKARGSYDGLLDLTGGSPKAGDSAVETVRGELREECGVELAPIRLCKIRVPGRAGFQSRER